MRRKKDPQTLPVDPAKFWPVPGVDGEPYPPRVQEALDLIAKETKRLKIQECKHEGRYPTTRFDGPHRRSHHVCACRDCGSDQIACVPTLEWDPRMRRTEIYGVPYERRTDPVVSRQTQRASAQLPVMVTLPSDPGTKPGALERAITKFVERDIQDLQRETERVRQLREGAMARSTGVYVARNALGEVVTVVPADDRAPDLSWIRTMSGKEKLR